MAKQLIVAKPADHKVVAGTGKNGIVAWPGVNEVVAGKGVHDVISTACIDSVSPAAAVNLVIAIRCGVNCAKLVIDAIAKNGVVELQWRCPNDVVTTSTHQQMPRLIDFRQIGCIEK